MKKFLKVLLALAVAAVLAAVGTLAVLKVKFPEARLKKMMADGIRNTLMRESSVNRVALGPGSLRFYGFNLSELPDFSAGTLFSAEEVTVRMRLLPLLARRVVIRQFLVDSPKLSLVRFPDNSFNFGISFGGGENTPPGGTAVPPKRSSRWVIERAELFGGKVIYDDRCQSFLSVIMEKLRFEAVNVSPGRPFDAMLSFTLMNKKQKVQFEGNMLIDQAAGMIELKNARIEAGKGALDIQGTLSGIGRAEGMEYQLRVRGDRSVLDTVGYVYPPLMTFQLFEADKIDVIISGGKEGLKVRSPQART